jgi:hypothetical protein
MGNTSSRPIKLNDLCTPGVEVGVIANRPHLDKTALIRYN